MEPEYIHIFNDETEYVISEELMSSTTLISDNSTTIIIKINYLSF